MPDTKGWFIGLSIVSVLLLAGLFYLQWVYTPILAFILIPLILLGIYDLIQKRHTILRIYPVVGHIRFLFESIRPEIQQYFVEDNINGTPVNREFRSLIYQRAKGMVDTRPFGTQFDVYRVGYEWVNHSIQPEAIIADMPKVLFGEGRCAQPYEASVFNVSAMSYGALSKTAIQALNRGAMMGGFYHNTGEGGISPYHVKEGGDLVWQIGTGYFGCRTLDGEFDPVTFADKAKLDQVKMIEIKISQGAKPGHGGFLPAAKVTPEIAKMRNVREGENVVSPPKHSAFSSPIELLEFVEKLRNLSGGKPVGFKISLGRTEDFLAICKAMIETEIVPDFITVDGGEGGTGSAPIEFTNSLGTPLREALNIVHAALIGFGLRDQIRLIASGKAFSAFHLFRLMALGADTVNSGRGMMFALGCIQSRTCNSDKCPTGVATQDPSRYKALDVKNKGARVANYQNSVVYHLLKIIAAAGLKSTDEIQSKDVMRRISATEVKSLAEIYPIIPKQSLLNEETVPLEWLPHWKLASAERW